MRASLAVLVIPSEENRFDMPQVGYGAREGWFVKTTYNYYRNPSFRGFLYLDYFSRLGPGLGVKHLYDFESLGAGSLYIYELLNRTTNHVQSKLELTHKVPMGSGIICTLGLKYSDSLSLAGTFNTQVSGAAKIQYNDTRGFADLDIDRAWKTGVSTSDETG